MAKLQLLPLFNFPPFSPHVSAPKLCRWCCIGFHGGNIFMLPDKCCKFPSKKVSKFVCGKLKVSEVFTSKACRYSVTIVFLGGIFLFCKKNIESFHQENFQQLLWKIESCRKFEDMVLQLLSLWKLSIF